MKIGVIVNPISGGGSAVSFIPEIKKQVPGITELVVTRKSGEATLAAESFSRSGFDFIIVAGGDGTLNEASQGIIGTESVLVPLPFGNGSDFTRSVGRIGITGLSEAMKAGQTRKIDTILVEYAGKKIHYINIMELGFGALVMKRFNDKRKFNGNTSFTRHILAEAAKLRTFSADISGDSFSFSGDIVECIIANGRYFGRGLLASPGSSIDDGIMDIHIIEKMGKAEFFMKLSKIRNGSYLSDRKVKNYAARSLEVATPGIPFEIDGEFIGFSPLRATINPQSLKIMQVPLE